MNKKQFFLLSLLVCPLSYQQDTHAGYLGSGLRGTVGVSMMLAAGYAYAIFLIGRSNQARPENQKSEQEKTHPFESAKETLDSMIVSDATAALEMAKAFAKKHSPFPSESTVRVETTTPSEEKRTAEVTVSSDDTATLEAARTESEATK